MDTIKECCIYAMSRACGATVLEMLDLCKSHGLSAQKRTIELYTTKLKENSADPRTRQRFDIKSEGSGENRRYWIFPK